MSLFLSNQFCGWKSFRNCFVRYIIYYFIGINYSRLTSDLRIDVQSALMRFKILCQFSGSIFIHLSKNKKMDSCLLLMVIYFLYNRVYSERNLILSTITFVLGSIVIDRTREKRIKKKNIIYTRTYTIIY